MLPKFGGRLATFQVQFWRRSCQEFRRSRSVEEAEDLSSDMLGTSLVVVHDALVGREDENTELTGRKDSVGEVLELSEGKIEAGGDDTALVEATVEVDNDLAGALIINDLELVDVAVLLHDLEELDEHLGGGSQDHLTSLTRKKVIKLSLRKEDVILRAHKLLFSTRLDCSDVQLLQCLTLPQQASRLKVTQSLSLSISLKDQNDLVSFVKEKFWQLRDKF